MCDVSHEIQSPGRALAQLANMSDGPDHARSVGGGHSSWLKAVLETGCQRCLRLTTFGLNVIVLVNDGLEAPAGVSTSFAGSLRYLASSFCPVLSNVIDRSCARHRQQ